MKGELDPTIVVRKASRTAGVLAWTVALACSVGCNGDDAPTDEGADTGDTSADTGSGPTSGDTSVDGTMGSATSSGPADGTDTGSDGGTTDGEALVGACGDPIPPGAPEPAPLPTYSGNACPTLQPGLNTIESSGRTREFVVVLPSDYDPAREQLPVIFMWHWLGGDAADFLEEGEVQQAADAMRFIAVVPEATDGYEVLLGLFNPVWPYMRENSEAQVAQELTFFDDMLACVGEQFSIDRHCVSSAGVSAGALWTAQLVQRRASLIANFISLSGGVGGFGGPTDQVRGWSTPERAVPGLVLWGGPTAGCGLGGIAAIDFQQHSQQLEQHMVSDGSYIVECIHNCGHGVPPIDAPPGGSRFEPIWRFALDHPYWISPGASLWQTEGLPEHTPEWCAQGAGNAEIRTGDGCSDPGC